MHISFVEICNFRKLESVRIDFSSTTTLLVGANNSGKTSAMVALNHFLVDRHAFNTNDFTLSRWPQLNNIGSSWELPGVEGSGKFMTPSEWESMIPFLDIWFGVADTELHYVRDLLPTLDWTGGVIGVRLRFEPEDIDRLQKEYLKARSAANETKEAAERARNDDGKYTLDLWPTNLRDFLDRRLGSLFTVRTYLLDPAERKAPEYGRAIPQGLPAETEPVETTVLKRLIQLDDISAQRGMAPTPDASDIDGDRNRSIRRGKLSHQLRAYYDRHLDPSENPEPEDLEALQAIEDAQRAFDGRLEYGFSKPLEELASLNYPGVTDPRLTIATRLRATDGLSHEAAVQYAVAEDSDTASEPLKLPEEYNGLGYQNLISMVFRLMAFRDSWMRVGKLAKSAEDSRTPEISPAPLHLVLIEEPEAHLHCQVQQVFVRKAYEVLRKHPHLENSTIFTTQLVVSTHSSHVAHEMDFSHLRYFRRLPPATKGDVPIKSVINLSEVFGAANDTERFVKRYLRTRHADLFFADAAILVEGPAERLLVPHFIRHHFKTLNRSYVSLLEIGGSHAHRLQRVRSLHG